MADMFTIKQNDTRPKLRSALTSGGAVLPLASTAQSPFTASVVKLKMRETGNAGAPKVNATAAIASAAGGVVEYTWAAADTDTPGTFDGEWEITWNDGGVETIPNDSYFTIVVKDDLD